LLVEKVQELGGDHRVEVRRANVHTLENIIMTHGNLLGEEVWNSILRNVLINLFKNSVEMYSQAKGGPTSKKTIHFETGLPTPTFSHSGWDTKKKAAQPKKKMNFDDEAVMKAL